jgi:hypothetical protein
MKGGKAFPALDTQDQSCSSDDDMEWPIPGTRVSAESEVELQDDSVLVRGGNVKRIQMYVCMHACHECMYE